MQRMGAIRSALKQITQNPGGVILHCSDGIINIDRVMQIVDQTSDSEKWILILIL